MATTQEALQVSAIVPNLTVDDLQKSITFCEALGFTNERRAEWKCRAFEVTDRSGFLPTIWSEPSA